MNEILGACHAFRREKNATNPRYMVSMENSLQAPLLDCRSASRRRPVAPVLFLGTVRRLPCIATEFSWRCAAVERGRGDTASPGSSREQDGDVAARPIRGVGILRLSIGTLEHETFAPTDDMAFVPCFGQARDGLPVGRAQPVRLFRGCDVGALLDQRSILPRSARAILEGQVRVASEHLLALLSAEAKAQDPRPLAPLLRLSGTKSRVNQLLDAGPRMTRDPPETSLDVLHLLAHLLDQHLHLHRHARQFQRG